MTLFNIIKGVLIIAWIRLKHKDSRIDIILPLAGVGLVVLTYLECIYQFIIYFVGD